MSSFETYPKIPRLYRECIITEKIDGTNAQVVIPEDPNNYGFAQFVYDNEAMIRRLGPGKHFGEWWGCGIARTYELTERRWWLFRTDKPLPEGLPSNIGQVPVLFRGEYNDGCVSYALSVLRARGSYAAPEYMKPEGIILFHRTTGTLTKVTLDGDGREKPKSRGPQDLPPDKE